MSYYNQSIQGHMELMAKRQAIDDLLEQKTLDDNRQTQLKTALAIRDFASQHLHLPDNGSYRSFVNLQRSHVVWNVVATGEFSLQPRLSCFLIVGCLSYRGYFSKADAEAFASQLKQQNDEVHIGGVAAYSTLGWFDDPLLSSLLPKQSGHDTTLTDIIFHELAHQQLYIANDSVFNEAFATTVGELGTRQWLQQSAENNQQATQAIKTYEQTLQRKYDFLAMLADIVTTLKALYQRDLSDQVKRQQKKVIFDDLKQGYQQLKQSWQGYNGYDRWFEQPVNNPRLALIAVYFEKVPDFKRWFTACDKDFRRFYQKMQSLKPYNNKKRHRILAGKAACH